MAYFNNDPQIEVEEDYEPVFQQPVVDDEFDEEEEAEYYTDEMYYGDYLTEEEKQELRQSKWRLLAGIGDFFGVLAGTVVILLLIALLISLVTWVQADISQSFTLWQTKI